MHERFLENSGTENRPVIWTPSEIQKPYKEEVTLFDSRDALVIDNQLVVAHKISWVREKNKYMDRVLVARDKSTPVKKEKTGLETMYSYPNEAELRDDYGVLILSVSCFWPVVNIGREYKLEFKGSNSDNGYQVSKFDIHSTNAIRTSLIDAKSDYCEYLRNINSKIA